MVTIGLASLPMERYKRNVIRGTLDLVVSIGGTAGLFVGASLLSFVEIFYYFIVRPYYRIRSEPENHLVYWKSSSLLKNFQSKFSPHEMNFRPNYISIPSSKHHFSQSTWLVVAWHTVSFTITACISLREHISNFNEPCALTWVLAHALWCHGKTKATHTQTSYNDMGFSDALRSFLLPNR